MEKGFGCSGLQQRLVEVRIVQIRDEGMPDLVCRKPPFQTEPRDHSSEVMMWRGPGQWSVVSLVCSDRGPEVPQGSLEGE